MHYLAPLFVTIDPQTDTEEKVKNVVELFNSSHNRRNVRLLGLTGPDTVKVNTMQYTLLVAACAQSHACFCASAATRWLVMCNCGIHM